jgi:hypothetical protein
MPRTIQIPFPKKTSLAIREIGVPQDADYLLTRFAKLHVNLLERDIEMPQQ